MRTTKLRRPQVWSPMSHGLHEADKLTLICRQFHVALRKGPAEEGNRTDALVKNSAESRPRRIAVHHKGPVKRRQLQHRRCRQCPFEGVKRQISLIRPVERVTPKKPGQGRRDGAVILDKPAVIAGQTEEAA